MNPVINFVILFVLIYLVSSAFYQLILAIAAQSKSTRTLASVRVFKKFLILIPSYKEDEVILKSIKKNKALSFQYPRNSFDLVVIADSLKRETISKIKSMGVQVVKVDFEKRSKVKALKAAMAEYPRGYDGVILLDADNLMNWDFLHRMNTYLHNGYKVIQGQRSPLNKENSVALMDGLAEIANHKMLCLGANTLGLSSKLSGSGMVFDFQLFKKVIGSLNAIGGFDKELELLFTERGQHIAYAEEAIVFDEKVGSLEAYEVQRGRWLEAQYSFFSKHWKTGLIGLFKGNFDYFHKVYQLALPPRLLLPFILASFVIIGLAVGNLVITITAVIGLISNISAYLIVLPFTLIKEESAEIIKSLPKLFFSTFKALGLMKRSKTEFLHTPHQIQKS